MLHKKALALAVHPTMAGETEMMGYEAVGWMSLWTHTYISTDGGYESLTSEKCYSLAGLLAMQSFVSFLNMGLVGSRMPISAHSSREDNSV